MPVVDVCLWLEKSEFIEGLDMAAYWKFPCEKIGSVMDFPKDGDIEQYIKECLPSETEYAKARLYGQVVTCRIGCLVDDYLFVLPQMVIFVLAIWFCFCTVLEKFTGLNTSALPFLLAIIK